MVLNSSLSGEGPIGISNAQCIGIENGLSNCYSDDNVRGACAGDHTHDASVICTSKQSGIRLVGGSSPYEGHIELRVEGSDLWGTVCNNGWDEQDAAVACRQMGFEDVLRVGRRGEFSNGGGPILLR